MILPIAGFLAILSLTLLAALMIFRPNATSAALVQVGLFMAAVGFVWVGLALHCQIASCGMNGEGGAFIVIVFAVTSLGILCGSLMHLLIVGKR